MKIGIIVAMGKELDLLLPLMEERHTEMRDGLEFHTGRIGANDVVAMQCGIGKVNAALGAAALISVYAPDVVINTGVAGGTGAAGVLDVIVGSEVAYHDVWCPGSEEGQVPDCPRRFPADPALLRLAAFDAPGVHRGLICSGDRFIDSAAQVEHILSNFPDAMAVDMESAAIAHTCYKKGIPFLSLRVLSDTPGRHDDNYSQYTDFWEQAPRQTFAILSEALKAGSIN